MGGKIILRDIAVRSIAVAIDAAAHDEERVHAALGRAIGIHFETRRAHRTVCAHERRHAVPCAVGACARYLRIDGRRCAADRWLRATTGARVKIEARSEAFADPFRCDEKSLGHRKICPLVTMHTGQRRAGAGVSRPHCRMVRAPRVTALGSRAASATACVA
jgi:hypothetical protein